MGSAAMPAAGAGAGAGAAATAVPTGEAKTTPVAAAAVVPVGGGGCDCLLGWRGYRAGWGGSTSCSACHFVSPPFPSKAMNSVEHGLVGVGQTPAHSSYLCLSGVPRVAAHFLQIFY